jgi:hypothetical protein
VLDAAGPDKDAKLDGGCRFSGSARPNSTAYSEFRDHSRALNRLLLFLTISIV